MAPSSQTLAPPRFPGFLHVCQATELDLAIGLLSTGLGSDLLEGLAVGLEPAALDCRVPERPPGPVADDRRSSAIMMRQTRSARRRFKHLIASLCVLPAAILVS